MYYIGIDLAWTNHQPSGVCILKNKKVIFLEAKVYSDQEIIKIIKENQPCIVSIDSPLVINNDHGGRLVDSKLMKTKINNRYLKLYATSRTYMTKVFGGIRGENILEGLKDEFVIGKTITETYPTGIYLSLFPHLFDHKYKISSRLSLESLVKHAKTLLNEIKAMGFELNLSLDLLNTKKAYKLKEDMIDSLLCGMNSYFLDHGKAIKFHDDNGCITLPQIYKIGEL
jgi:predicted RNase H-like nuclease